MAADLFNKGEQVVYPGHGLGTVVGSKTEIISETTAKFLMVSFESGMTLRIPSTNVKKSGLRGIASRGAMQDVFSVLRTPPARKKSMWRHRALEYAAKIKSGDPCAIAEIVRDLHRSQGQAEGSYSEKAIYQQAWDHLIPEVAAVESVDREAAAKKVVSLLEAA